MEVHSGAVIGSDGFGYVYGEERWWKFPQIGSVEDRGTTWRSASRTQRLTAAHWKLYADWRAGVKIDNLVQVAHNVRIGEDSVIASQAGISGSSTLGKRVMLGGQVGIADHCTLEDGAVVGAQERHCDRKNRAERVQIVWGWPMARPLERSKKHVCRCWCARLLGAGFASSET